jgi:hypothetical protein
MIDWLFNPLAKLKPSKSIEPDDIRMLWSLDFGHATMQDMIRLASSARRPFNRMAHVTERREGSSRFSRKKTKVQPDTAARLSPLAFGLGPSAVKRSPGISDSKNTRY